MGDLELDEDEYAEEVAANAAHNEPNPDLEDLMQQHGVNREQQQGAGAADVEMQDADEQQENIPPAGGSQQQQQSQGGEKQQQGEKQTQAGMQPQTQPRKSTTISAEKYEFVKVRVGHARCSGAAVVHTPAAACCYNSGIHVLLAIYAVKCRLLPLLQ